MIHDPARYTDEVYFCGVAQQRPLTGGDRLACGVFESKGRGHFECGGGTQPGSDGKIRGDRALKAAEPETPGQFDGNSLRVSRPSRAICISWAVSRYFNSLSESGRVKPDHGGAHRPPGDDYVTFDCCRQDQPVVVVRVLADQVDATRCLGQEERLAAEDRSENLDRPLDGVGTHRPTVRWSQAPSPRTEIIGHPSTR